MSRNPSLSLIFFVLLHLCSFAQEQQEPEQQESRTMMLFTADGPAQKINLFEKYDLKSFKAKLQDRREGTVQSFKYQLMENEDLSGSIEMTPDQVSSLKNAFEDFSKIAKAKADSIHAKITALKEKQSTDPGNRESYETEIVRLESNLQDIHRDFINEIDRKVDNILLPFQLDAISEIADYFLVSSSIPDTERYLWPYYLGTSLGFSEDELESIRKATVKAKSKLDEEIAEAEQRALDSVLKSLPPSRRTTLEKFLKGQPDFLRKKGLKKEERVP